MAICKRGFGLRIFLFLSLVLWGNQAFAINCPPTVAAVALKRLAAHIETDDMAKMSHELAAHIVENGELPDLKELAARAEVDLRKSPVKSTGRRLVADLVAYTKAKRPEDFKRVRAQFMREVAQFVGDHFRAPTLEDLAEAMEISAEEVELIYGPIGDLAAQVAETSPKTMERLRNRIAFTYATEAMRTGRSPEETEIAQALDMSLEQFRGVLASQNGFDFAAVKTLAHALRPRAFERVIDTELFNDERIERMRQADLTSKKKVYTTVVAGAPLSEGFLASLRAYHEAEGAPVFVRPQNMITTGLDPVLFEHDWIHILVNTVEDGPTLALRHTGITAKQINTLTGLDRIGKRGQVQLFGSPKMFMRTVATVNNDTAPHILASTGALSEAYYEGALFIQKRLDEVAYHDHRMGAIIVEKDVAADGSVAERKNIFHLRHIEYIPERGGFSDLGRFYSGKSISKERKVLAISMELHSGDTDMEVFDTLPALTQFLHPQYFFIEDLFNGHSVNHHVDKQPLERARMAAAGLLNVDAELKLNCDMLNRLLAMDPNVIIIVKDSNHNRWLRQWLEARRYDDDPYNTLIGLELAAAVVRGQDPLEFGISKHGLSDPSRVKFLKVGEKFSVGPANRRVEMSLHGDRGAANAKLSLESLRKAVDSAVVGHLHTLWRANGIAVIGTLTKLILGYNAGGFSNWVQAVGVVGENGEIQVLMHRNGRWFSPPEAPAPDPKDFFEPGYPNIIPNNLPSDGAGQVDQYGSGGSRKKKKEED